MRLVRRQRQRLLLVCFGLLFAVVAWLTLVRPSAVHHAAFLGGFHTLESPGVLTYHTMGLTEWLIVWKRSWSPSAGGPLMVDRHLRPNPPGVILAIMVLLAMGVLGPLACRRLVHALRTRRHCDECGYDLTGRTSSYCPECGVVGEA